MFGKNAATSNYSVRPCSYRCFTHLEQFATSRYFSIIATDL